MTNLEAIKYYEGMLETFREKRASELPKVSPEYYPLVEQNYEAVEALIKDFLTTLWTMDNG